MSEQPDPPQFTFPPPPVGPGEFLHVVQIDPAKLHSEVVKVLRALAKSDAIEISKLEITIVLGYVLGIYMQAAGAKLRPEVSIESMLPAVVLGYQEAVKMGLAEQLGRKGQPT